jgi:hypothetical protein
LSNDERRHFATVSIALFETRMRRLLRATVPEGSKQLPILWLLRRRSGTVALPQQQPSRSTIGEFTMTPSQPDPPGWKSDPTDSTAERYWDGSDWTPMRRRRVATTQSPPAPPFHPAATPMPARPQSFPAPNSGSPVNQSRRKFWIAVTLVASVGIGILGAIAWYAAAREGSHSSAGSVVKSAQGTVYGGEMDWVNAVCQLGTFIDGRGTLPAATGKGMCRAKNGTDYISIGEYDSNYKMRNDLVMTREGYYASAIETDGTVVVLTVRSSPTELEPLTKFGFTINNVQKLS